MTDIAAPAPGFLFVTRLTANNPITDGPFQTYELAEKRAKALKAQMPDSVVLISRIFARVIENPHKFLVETLDEDGIRCFGPPGIPPLSSKDLPPGNLTSADIIERGIERIRADLPVLARDGPPVRLTEPELPASLDRRPKKEVPE